MSRQFSTISAQMLLWMVALST
ncbi:hypothetical protein Golob_026132 [Gossypium lobatum]|uniref:Uncharacterized protein n=1 Tax=Gossypium lobatum TaxID=34289 RepID=A0A7J8LU53_9ROSI|nr:hypothetical protein [Gossypium lobatum]